MGLYDEASLLHYYLTFYISEEFRILKLLIVVFVGVMDLCSERSEHYLFFLVIFYKMKFALGEVDFHIIFDNN